MKVKAYNNLGKQIPKGKESQINSNTVNRDINNKNNTITRPFSSKFKSDIANSKLIKFDFKVKNNSVANFNEFENFRINDISNKQTNKKILFGTIDHNKSKNNITGGLDKCVVDNKKSKEKKHYYEASKPNTPFSLHVDNLKDQNFNDQIVNPCLFNFTVRGKVEDFKALKKKKHFVNFYII